MKRIFFTLFLVLIITSCEDDINSPNTDPPTLLGCTNQLACNYDLIANTDDGSCIYGIVGKWTATNVVGDSAFIVSYMGVTVDSLSSSGTITATPEIAGSPTSY